MRTGVPLDDLLGQESTRVSETSEIEREGERKRLDLRTIGLLDGQEGRLIYMQAASSASSILYSSGDLGCASDGE